MYYHTITGTAYGKGLPSIKLSIFFLT